MTSSAEALREAVGAFVDELTRAGVRHVCVCPGSRSTPLAVALADHPAIKVWMHLDERSAAYFGLGLARTLRAPVGLLATSGTAAANFFPAVVEAQLARIPLLVLTADRPHELRDVGAPQTIDQLHLYGSHAKWFFDLPEPESTAEHRQLVRVLAARAVATAAAEPAGPVHLNWPFREPLFFPAPARQASRLVTSGARPHDAPYVRVNTGLLAPPGELIQRLSEDLSAARRGVIVCGPQDDPLLPAAVARLARRLGYPILADPLSGVRCGRHDRGDVVDAYDAFLRDATTVERFEPRVVVRLGAPPTSKVLQQYLQRYAGSRQVVVDASGWRDPAGLASDVLHVDPRLLCDALVSVRTAGDSTDTGWVAAWRATNAAARRSIDAHLQTVDELFEGKVIASLAALLPESAVVYAGNSMPVRDLDTFLPATSRTLRCLANRGANGIDGVVSSALGASAAGSGPVVLVIGDISFYHDLNGLLAAGRHRLDLLVVLVNNDGGGIFSFLPQAELATERFELLFGTPLGLDFSHFVAGYGGHFTRAYDWPAFEAAVVTGLARGGLRVVEVPTQRDRNVVLHRDVWRVVAQALSGTAAAVA